MKQFFQDGNGDLSMMRLLCAACVLLIFIIVVTWSWISFKTGEVQNFPDLAVFGVLFSALISKAGQAYAER